MRIFKNKWFVKFARKEGISSQKLIQAVKEVDAGNVDADYGGGVIKQRIARTQEGKSGGYRTIILTVRTTKLFLFLVLPRVILKTLTRRMSGISRN